jgi:hypothetical protein
MQSCVSQFVVFGFTEKTKRAFTRGEKNEASDGFGTGRYAGRRVRGASSAKHN